MKKTIKINSGFWKENLRMTVISLTESVLEENETVVSIFLDLAKAFNSISH